MKHHIAAAMVALLFIPTVAFAESPATPNTMTSPAQHGHMLMKRRRPKKRVVVLPIAEIHAALTVYIAKNEGDAQGLRFPSKPSYGECAPSEHCKEVYYLQAYTGPHGEIGGQAIIKSTISRPSIFTVITLAAGASDTVEGFEDFDIPASAARELLHL